MTAQAYTFKRGQFTCTVLADDASLISRERFLRRFPDATEADYRQAYADMGLDLDAADNAMNILLIQTGAETVLVDTGEAGQPYGGHLLGSMQQAGVAPADVTLVVITHAHGDHVRGLLTPDSMPTFPNARYVLSKQEMVFWRERIDTGITPDHAPILAMIEQQGLRLIDMDETIIAGIQAIPLVGHTLGQIGLLIESDGERLLHLADALHSPMQVAHPNWSARFDADTNLSVPTRRAALGRAADEDLLTLFYHLTFPGLGHITRAADAFVWQPLAP